MCHPRVFFVLLPVFLFASLVQGFFMPVFVRKASQTPAAPVSSQGWSSQQQINSVAPQSSFKEYGIVNNHLNQYQPVPVAPIQQLQPVQQYSYETAASLAYNPYSQLQPMFHNVQMVPCLCPLTRDVIEQQSQQLQQQGTSPPAAENSKGNVKPTQ